MAADHVPKTAIITPFGLFEFLRMPFGLKNVAQAFQRLMDGILRGIDFVFVYLDDILVASRTPQEHLSHLKTLFRLLSTNGITINREKSKFGRQEVTYLGHLVNARGSFHSRTESLPLPRFPYQSQRWLCRGSWLSLIHI